MRVKEHVRRLFGEFDLIASGSSVLRLLGPVCVNLRGEDEVWISIVTYTRGVEVGIHCNGEERGSSVIQNKGELE